jgi:hypothetical protein
MIDYDWFEESKIRPLKKGETESSDTDRRIHCTKCAAGNV